jgi:hypothetical protein
MRILDQASLIVARKTIASQSQAIRKLEAQNAIASARNAVATLLHGPAGPMIVTLAVYAIGAVLLDYMVTHLKTKGSVSCAKSQRSSEESVSSSSPTSRSRKRADSRPS